MDSAYFKEIPEWDIGKPSFVVLADQFSGRIPVTRIENWKTLADALEDRFFNLAQEQQVFRGHRRCDWGLTPSLARLSPASIISRDTADRQLELFRLAVRGRLADSAVVNDGEEDELWSVGQHHGLQTPLLDWTYSPYVALFFAFEKPDRKHESDNPYRAVYVLNKTSIANDSICPEIRVLEPRRDEYGRLVNQAGLFTFSPYDETIESYLINTLGDDEETNIDLDDANALARYICKIYIANEDREGCLRHLRRMNVHHSSLFPDLIGASEYCNIFIAEETLQHAEEKKAVEAKRKARNEKEEVDRSAEDSTPTEKRKIPIIVEILKAPQESKQVEPARIEVLADELESVLSKHLVVDWEDRESAQARLRNLARITLRKFGYPISIRDEVANQVIAAMVAKEIAKTAPVENFFSKALSMSRDKKATKKKTRKKRQ